MSTAGERLVKFTHSFKASMLNDKASMANADKVCQTNGIDGCWKNKYMLDMNRALSGLT